MRLGFCSLLLLPVLASAQISETFTYNGTHRPFLVKVSAPRRAKLVEVKLLEPVSAAVIGSAKVKPGTVDLGKVLPTVWSMTKPHLVYAQVFADDRAVGPALVLQPMTNPATCTLAADGKGVKFEPDDEPAFTGYRVWVDQDLEFDTSLGKIRFRLRPDYAPNTTWNIMQLAKGGYYREVIFHRIVAVARGFPFVIQGGDPSGTGSGGPGFYYPLEDSSLPHDFGVLSIARSTDPNTNGSQFFFALSREGTSRLDHNYASFGEAISGADVIKALAVVKVGDKDRPSEPPVLHNVNLVPAAPYGEGPKPVKK